MATPRETSTQRTAKVFTTNRSQAIRLPREFRFQTSEVFIQKRGDQVILTPRPDSWSAYLDSGSRLQRLHGRRRRSPRAGALRPGAAFMPLYMLDTDISSYIMKRTHEAVLRRLRKTAVSDVCISAITQAELAYGVEVSPRKSQDAEALHEFLRYVQVLGFPSEAGTDYAQIRAHLKQRGTMIGANDLLIAAHARALKLTLVTNNTREFSRVPGLTLENWAAPARAR